MNNTARFHKCFPLASIVSRGFTKHLSPKRKLKCIEIWCRVPNRSVLICFNKDSRAYVLQRPQKRMENWCRVPTHSSFICFNTASESLYRPNTIETYGNKHLLFVSIRFPNPASPKHYWQLWKVGVGWQHIHLLSVSIRFLKFPPLKALLKREDYSHGNIGSLKMNLAKANFVPRKNYG